MNHPFQAPGLFSTAVFLVIVVFVLIAIIGGTYRASRELGQPPGPPTLSVARFWLIWIGFVSVMTVSGFAAAAPMPRLPMMVVLIILVSIAFALLPPGKRLAQGLPLASLVGFQAFRLPLELVLHSWVAEGSIPETMTWSGATGANFDIISGIVALLAIPFANRYRWVAWAANLIGFGLLLNVLRVVAFSSPLPFAWAVEPPLLLAFHLPYVWIAPVCVGGAMAGHLILTRALLTGLPKGRRSE